MLRSTAAGLFTVDALRRLSELHAKVGSTREKFSGLPEYFGENRRETGGTGRHDPSKRPHEFFSIFSEFARDFAAARPPKKRPRYR